MADPPIVRVPRPKAIWSRQGRSNANGLSQSDVQSIINAAVAAADQTRAVIRLPIGTRAEMAIAVSDLDGTLLALHRMPDATVFSIDVAVAKSRNVIYFTSIVAASAHRHRGHQSHHRFRRAAAFTRRASMAHRPARSSICTRTTSRIHARKVRSPAIRIRTELCFSPAVCRYIGTACWWADSASAAMASIRTITSRRKAPSVFRRPRPFEPIR